MSRIADAVNRAAATGWTATASPLADDDWLHDAVDAAHAAPTRDRPVATAVRSTRRSAGVRPTAAELDAYERIAAFAIGGGAGCRDGGERVLLFTSVNAAAASARVVLGAAAAAARRGAAPVAVVDGCAADVRHENDRAARDTGNGVWIVPGMPGSDGDLPQLLAAFTRRFGLVFVHGPAALTDRAVALAAATSGTLLLGPASGAGVAAAVARLGRSRICGVIAVNGSFGEMA